MTNGYYYMCACHYCICSLLFIGSLTKKLFEELNKDHNNIPVKELFVPVTTSSGSQLACKFFSTENVPNELLQHLYIIGKKYPNDIFESCWRQQSKSYANLNTFEGVHQMVCTPVFNECEQILVSLEQGTMTLENVENYFSSFHETNELKNNLEKLCQGIRECFPNHKHLRAPRSWVPSVVTSIQEYKKLNGYTAAAKIVLQLKDSMKLNGDFTAVNTIVEQVNII